MMIALTVKLIPGKMVVSAIIVIDASRVVLTNVLRAQQALHLATEFIRVGVLMK